MQRIINFLSNLFSAKAENTGMGFVDNQVPTLKRQIQQDEEKLKKLEAEVKRLQALQKEKLQLANKHKKIAISINEMTEVYADTLVNYAEARQRVS